MQAERAMNIKLRIKYDNAVIETNLCFMICLNFLYFRFLCLQMMIYFFVDFMTYIFYSVRFERGECASCEINVVMSTNILCSFPVAQIFHFVPISFLITIGQFVRNQITQHWDRIQRKRL